MKNLAPCFVLISIAMVPLTGCVVHDRDDRAYGRRDGYYREEVRHDDVRRDDVRRDEVRRDDGDHHDSIRVDVRP